MSYETVIEQAKILPEPLLASSHLLTHHKKTPMNKNAYIIHLGRKEEYRETQNLVCKSFWNVYHPRCQERYILRQLRNNPTFMHKFDYVRKSLRAGTKKQEE